MRPAHILTVIAVNVIVLAFHFNPWSVMSIIFGVAAIVEQIFIPVRDRAHRL